MATLTRTEEIKRLAAEQEAESRTESRDRRGRLRTSRWRRSKPFVTDSSGFQEPPIERSGQEEIRRPGRRWLKPDPQLTSFEKKVGDENRLSLSDYRQIVARRTWLKGDVEVSAYEGEAGYAYGRWAMADYEIRTAGSTLLKQQPLPPSEEWPWAIRRPAKVEIPSASAWTPQWPKPDIKVYRRSASTRTITDQQAFERMCHQTLLYTHRVDALDQAIRHLVWLYLEECAVRLGKGDPRMLRVRPRRGPKRRGLFAPVKMGGADPADERELTRRLVIEEQFEELAQRLHGATDPMEELIARRARLRREDERDWKAIWAFLEEQDAKWWCERRLSLRVLYLEGNEIILQFPQ